MPWSGSRQRAAAASAQRDEERRGVVVEGDRAGPAAGAAAPSSSPYTSSWRWSHAPLPTRTGRLSAPAGQVGQLALGQVVLAADAEHDLQVAASARPAAAAAVAMNAKKSSASSGQAATHRASS